MSETKDPGEASPSAEQLEQKDLDGAPAASEEPEEKDVPSSASPNENASPPTPRPYNKRRKKEQRCIKNHRLVLHGEGKKTALLEV